MFRIALPDLHYTIENQIAEGDQVATRWTATGTHKGEFMGIPPTDKQVTVTGISIDGIASGKIVEGWTNSDALGLMQQLGVIPPDREDYTWGEASKVTGEPGEAEANKALAHRFFEAILNQGKLDTVDQIFATDYIAHVPGIPEISSSEAAKQTFALILTAFPDVHHTVEAMFAEGDKVVVRFTAKGTNQSEFMGIPATKKVVTWCNIAIFRCASGKIQEAWHSADFLSIMQQLGVIPTPGQSEA